VEVGGVEGKAEEDAADHQRDPAAPQAHARVGQGAAVCRVAPHLHRLLGRHQDPRLLRRVLRVVLSDRHLTLQIPKK